MVERPAQGDGLQVAEDRQQGLANPHGHHVADGVFRVVLPRPPFEIVELPPDLGHDLVAELGGNAAQVEPHGQIVLLVEPAEQGQRIPGNVGQVPGLVGDEQPAAIGRFGVDGPTCLASLHLVRSVAEILRLDAVGFEILQELLEVLHGQERVPAWSRGG